MNGGNKVSDPILTATELLDEASEILETLEQIDMLSLNYYDGVWRVHLTRDCMEAIPGELTYSERREDEIAYPWEVSKPFNNVIFYALSKEGPDNG